MTDAQKIASLEAEVARKVCLTDEQVDRIIDNLTELGVVDKRTDPVPLIQDAVSAALSQHTGGVDK
jgi:predicted transcriptional regulator